jgi:hypothetical protein
LCTGKDGLPAMLRLKKKMEEEARKKKISEQNKQNIEMNKSEQNKQQPQKQEQEPLKNEVSVNKKSEMSYNIPRSQEEEIDIRFNPSTLNQ